MDNNRMDLDEEEEEVVENLVPFVPDTSNLHQTVNSAPLFVPSPQPAAVPPNFPPHPIPSFSNLSNASTRPPSFGMPTPSNNMSVFQSMNHYNSMANVLLYSKNLVLNTDEPLEIVAEKVNSESYENLLSFSINPLCEKLKLTTPIELPCTVTLKGGISDMELIEKNRQGLDLIFVVDISGSMGSGKIELVKTTIEFVITLLKDFDRVSIVGFSDSAFIYCPLTVMNDQGKIKLTRIVNTLGPTGGTHIECGVRAALHMLADRKVCNQVASILLLSDGCDNDTKSVNKRIQLAINEFKPRIKGSYRMHTFGYGRDHDSVVMNLMADLTNGNFYYIENEAAVTDAFANCMGELIALLASNIQVSLTTKACEVPFKLSKVYSNTGDTVFTMPNVFYADKKDSVFVLDFEVMHGDFVGHKIVPIEAIATFTLINGEKTRKTAVLELVIAGNDEEIKKDEKVLLEYYRVKGAESLKQVMEFADAGKFAEAREVARISEEEISRSEVANNPKIQALIRDIKDSQVRTESKNSWNSGGRAQVTSIQNSHFNKVAKGNCMSYQTPVQCAFSVNSNVYMNSKPVPANYAKSVPITQNYAPPGMLQQAFPGSLQQPLSGFPPPQMSGPLQFQAPLMSRPQKLSKSVKVPLIPPPQPQAKKKTQAPQLKPQSIPGPPKQVPNKKNS